MADKTGIEWTDATWNPVTGCDKVSAGCDHCYAETLAHRFDGTPQFPNGFRVTLRPDRLNQPLRWRRPRRIFVNSMSDLFHDDVPRDYVAEVWAVMAWSPHHTFQILTKRHGRMRNLLSSRQFRSLVDDYWYEFGRGYNLAAKVGHPGHPYDRWPLPNVWLGVSAENQQWADIRIPALLDTPADVRFVSAEPLLGPITLADEWLPTRCGNCDCDMGCNPAPGGLDWVIVGGESGHGARPMHTDWARGLRDQCQASGVAFLFKQWGEHVTVEQMTAEAAKKYSGPAWDGTDGVPWRVGKRAAGRELDGRTWDQYPEAVTHVG